MRTQQLKGWRKFPTVAAFVKSALGNSYRKTKVLIRGGDRVTLHDLQWSSVTRNEYHAITCSAPAGRWVPTSIKLLSGSEGENVEVLDHCAIGCWFCGKQSTFLLVIRDADLPDLIGSEALAALEELA